MIDPDIEFKKAEANLEIIVNNRTDDIEIQRLSKLSLMELDRQLPEVAKKLGVKKSTLEKKVNELKESQQNIKTNIELFKKYEPWSDLVNGELLLNEITLFLSDYVVLPEGAREAIALWVINTYCQKLTRISPLLTITSPDKRCGKTTLLTLLSKIVNRPLSASNISASALFRSMELWQPTLIIDEADSFLGNSDELRGIINSGHTKETAFVIRSVGDEHEPKQFYTFGAKAIASIGNLAPTIMDRSIVINLRRKKSSEVVNRLLFDKINADDLVRKCIRWVKDNKANIKLTDPLVPEKLHDRACDNWRPLFVISDLCGNNWSTLSRKAAQKITPFETDDDTASILLLEDMQTYFKQNRLTRITSIVLADDLIKMDERPWPEYKNGKPITPRQIAKLLKPFGIKPKVIRTVTGTPRGYLFDDLKDTFLRYLGV